MINIVRVRAPPVVYPPRVELPVVRGDDRHRNRLRRDRSHEIRLGLVDVHKLPDSGIVQWRAVRHVPRATVEPVAVVGEGVLGQRAQPHRVLVVRERLVHEASPATEVGHVAVDQLLHRQPVVQFWDQS